MQPNKVARIEIGYARTAKMLNVRRLKGAMWNFLEMALPPPHPAAPRSPAISVASTSSAPVSLAEDPSPFAIQQLDPQMDAATALVSATTTTTTCSKVPGARGFRELVDNLHSRINWQMAKELSTSIALNCLLHLSNEKVTASHHPVVWVCLILQPNAVSVEANEDLPVCLCAGIDRRVALF